MRYLSLVLLLLIFTLPAHAQDKMLDIQEVTSKSGVTAWLVEDHSIPVIALQAAFKGAGAALDAPDKQGLATLVSNTMDEGAGPLDSQTFQKELRDLSINLSFGAGRDNFEANVKTLTVNKNRAFELMTLALTQPRFDAEPLERMREANKSRILESMSDPDWIAARLQNDLAFAGHPYALNVGGTLTTLQALTAQDLRNFVKTRLGKNTLHIGVAGDITAAELSTVLDQVFRTLPDVTLAEIPQIDVQNQGKTYLYTKDIPQTIVAAIQPGISRLDPDYNVGQIMNYILGGGGFGSRLTEEVREKRGLTYGIYSAFFLFDRFNGYMLGTSTANANVKQVLDLSKVEWERMSATLVTQKELDDAKAYLIGSLPLSLSSTDEIAGLMISLQLDDLPMDYLDKREQQIRNATAEDVQRVAERILNAPAFMTILVGQPEGIEGAIPLEKLPNVE